jgi:hypothetical protein
MHHVGAGVGLAGIPCTLLTTTLQLHTQAASRVLVAVITTLKNSLQGGSSTQCHCESLALLKEACGMTVKVNQSPAMAQA